MPRYLLCRPAGGLNDILCQIERCCRYAQTFDRTVVVDTNFVNTHYFRDSFDRYFDSAESGLILSAADLIDALADMDVFPDTVQGRLRDYRTRYENASGAMLDKATGALLTFDFSRDYPHQVLLHHQVGGGLISAQCISRLTITRALADELARRCQWIGSDYAGIHIRHTDYRTNYRGAIDALKTGPHERLFVATDNLDVLKELGDALGRERVFSFAVLPLAPGKPLHSLRLDPPRTFQRNRDAILDLLMLGLAKTLYLLEVENNPHGSFSGYSTLAQALHEGPDLLRRVIGDRRFPVRTG